MSDDIYDMKKAEEILEEIWNDIEHSDLDPETKVVFYNEFVEECQLLGNLADCIKDELSKDHRNRIKEVMEHYKRSANSKIVELQLQQARRRN